MAFRKALGRVDLRDGHAPVESSVPCPLSLEHRQGGPTIWLKSQKGNQGKCLRRGCTPPPNVRGKTWYFLQVRHCGAPSP